MLSAIILFLYQRIFSGTNGSSSRSASRLPKMAKSESFPTLYLPSHIAACTELYYSAARVYTDVIVRAWILLLRTDVR